MKASWRWRWLVGATGLLALVAGAVAAEEPRLSDRVDELFVEWSRTDAPGAAVAVIRDGRIVYQNAYGMADLERGVALTPSSAFEIGSLSKQFTAMCVLLLDLEGKLSLDDDVRTYIPEMPAYEKTITMRHLLHHTSGIRDIETLIPLAGLPWVNFYSPTGQLELIARQKALNFPPNSRHLYSNSGYLLLALIVERVSGLPLREFAKQRVFDPLGMHHSVFWNRPEQIVENRSIAYSPDGNGGWGMEMWNLPFAGPAGLYTTVGDLALWDANFYDNRLGGGAELIERMEMSGVLDDGEAVGYASGLVVGTLWDLPVVRHGGAWMGYRAGMMRFPEQRLSVVLLSNAASIDVGSGDVARLYLADEIESSADEAATFEPPETVDLSAEQLAAYEGRYWSEEAGLLRTIEVREGALRYVRGPGNETELGAVEPGRFFMIGPSSRVDVVFDEAAEGPAAVQTPRTMTVIQGEDGLVFDAVPPPPDEDLSDLVGDYWSDELQRELRLENESGRLLVGWTDETETSLAEPIRSDEYVVPRFIPVPWSPQDVRLRLERDDTRRITGLTLSSEMVSGISLTKRGL